MDEPVEPLEVVAAERGGTMADRQHVHEDDGVGRGGCQTGNDLLFRDGVEVSRKELVLRQGIAPAERPVEEAGLGKTGHRSPLRNASGEIDERGLNQTDRDILTIVVEKFGGGPVGLKTIAAALSEEEATIEEVNEPYLMQTGLIERTPRGRTVTPKGHEHIGADVPKKISLDL